MNSIYRILTMVAIVFSCHMLTFAQPGIEMETKRTIEIMPEDSEEVIIKKAAHVVPTENQLQSLKNEFIAFIHFGPNTFTRMEWGNGMEDPQIFALENLDTDQWCEAMKAAGMKMVIITVKHHDGFVLWQSRYTKHGIMSSPYQNGKGDILKELSLSCEKFGLKLGVYLSPADLYQIENKEGLYGNLSKYTERTIPRPVKGRPFRSDRKFTFKVDDYNEYFLNQLYELLTEYGPIHEVWFDGAHPKRKGGQTYNYLAWKELIKTLAPEATIFGKEDIRWCGNESGGTRDTEWNVIPYQNDPQNMNRFADITAKDIGSREKLYDAKFLHYQQAETNTSIREGWFYRDDDKQKVRNADDVFDIYERSVGGNSTFLLNIPPNRDGKFSPEDVSVLKEVGKRIKNTYGDNLLKHAQGPKEVLDEDYSTYLLLDTQKEIEINLEKPVTINRFNIQESISTHGERIEEHALDAWDQGEWKEVASSTNVGYKRILRFPEVTSTKFRLRILKDRMAPAIAHVSAHYYETRPPQLQVTRNVNGLVSIKPKQHDFSWKPHGEDAAMNLNRGTQIYYTTDGSSANSNSKRYDGPFHFDSGVINAVSQVKGALGSPVSKELGLVKGNWEVLGQSSEEMKHPAVHAIDAKSGTYWQSNNINEENPYIAIDLGTVRNIKSFKYTPPKNFAGGMIEQGQLYSSKNGKDWKLVDSFEFGNLINDPSTRTHELKTPTEGRYFKIEALTIAGEGKSAAIAELEFFQN